MATLELCTQCLTSLISDILVPRQQIPCLSLEFQPGVAWKEPKITGMSLFTPHQEIIQTTDHSSSSDSHPHRRGWKEAQLQILWIRDDWSRQGCASSRRQGCSVSVFNPTPKFTMNHSQKGKAGADRILQGCDSQSTIPAQPLHPSTALCEMTTSPLIRIEKYFFFLKALFLNFIPHDLYSLTAHSFGKLK